MNILEIVNVNYDSYSRIESCGGEYLDTLQIPLVESALLRFHFKNEDGTDKDLSDTATYEIGIAITAGDTLAVATTINEGNWTLEDLSKGYISADLIVNTNEMQTAIDAQIDPLDDLAATLEVWRTPDGGSRTLILSMEVGVGNTVLDDSSPIPTGNIRSVTHDADGDLVSPANFFTKNKVAIASNVFSVMSTSNVSAVALTANVASSSVGGVWDGNLSGTGDTLYNIIQAVDNFTLGGWVGTAETDLDMGTYNIQNATNVAATSFFGNGDNIELTSTLDGNLSGVTPNLNAIITAVDDLSLGGGGAAGGTLSFSYMMLSKCFSASSLGWVSEEFDTGVGSGNYEFSAGGYASASASLVNGDAYIELVMPNVAAGYDATKTFEITFVSTSNVTTDCKVDVYVYKSVQQSAPVLCYSNIGYCPSTANIPSTFSTTFSSWDSAYDRYNIKITFYSKSNNCVKLVSGAIHFI